MKRPFVVLASLVMTSEYGLKSGFFSSFLESVAAAGLGRSASTVGVEPMIRMIRRKDRRDKRVDLAEAVLKRMKELLERVEGRMMKRPVSPSGGDAELHVGLRGSGQIGVDRRL